jgi:hypothetical protein
MREIF